MTKPLVPQVFRRGWLGNVLSMLLRNLAYSANCRVSAVRKTQCLLLLLWPMPPMLQPSLRLRNLCCHCPCFCSRSFSCSRERFLRVLGVKFYSRLNHDLIVLHNLWRLDLHLLTIRLTRFFQMPPKLILYIVVMSVRMF